MKGVTFSRASDSTKSFFVVGLGLFEPKINNVDNACQNMKLLKGDFDDSLFSYVERIVPELTLPQNLSKLCMRDK